jgi:hypothetical protein
VNVRLDTDDVDVIEAAAFSERRSVAEFLKPLLEQLASELRADPAVQMALRSRAEKGAESDGTLSKRRIGRSAP